jgi:hypothetical protein
MQCSFTRRQGSPDARALTACGLPMPALVRAEPAYKGCEPAARPPEDIGEEMSRNKERFFSYLHFKRGVLPFHEPVVNDL